jgi:hypothetical protein
LAAHSKKILRPRFGDSINAAFDHELMPPD